MSLDENVRSALLERLGQWSRMAPTFRGKARLQRAAQKVLGGVGGAREVEIEGIRWTLDAAELIQFRLFGDGAHDAHVLGWLVREARRLERPVVWDVGANIGDMALLLAKRVPGARVEAFEPSPTVFRMLSGHVLQNPWAAVTARPLGLSNHNGKVSFFASNESGNGGVGSLMHAANTQADAVEVRVARGDTLVESGEVARPQLVKMDIEGFEPEALEGLEATLARYRPLLCVESSAYRLDDRGLRRDAIISMLEKLDYRVMAVTVEGERAVVKRDLDTDVDLAARPR